MFKKFWDWIKRPHGMALVIVYILTAIFVAGAIAACIEAKLFGNFAYVFYALAAISFSYTVYTLVIIIPQIKRGIVNKMKKRAFTGKLIDEYGFRTLVFAVISFVISIANAVLNGTIGILYLSLWYGALGAYYLLLAVMRGGVLLYHRRKRRLAENESQSRLKIRELKTYRSCGVALVFLPVIMSAVILQTVATNRAFVHPGMMIYVTALYTFYKLTMSIYNFFKAKKSDDMSLRAIRNVNLADSLVSLFALQTAMYHEFSPEESFGTGNAVTGGLVCVLTAVLGIVMIIVGCLSIKKVKKEEYENVREVQL